MIALFRRIYSLVSISPFSYFFSTTPTIETYTLSLHDALPILMDGYEFVRHVRADPKRSGLPVVAVSGFGSEESRSEIGRATRLNSSHTVISYAVFCLKKKKKKIHTTHCIRN